MCGTTNTTTTAAAAVRPTTGRTSTMEINAAQRQHQRQQQQQQEDNQIQEEQRKSVALEAASVGRLSRLYEVVVESVTAGDSSAIPAEEEWKAKRSIQTVLLKSSFQRCIQEAAAVGLVRRLEPLEVVSNHSSSMGNNNDDYDTPTLTDNYDNAPANIRQRRERRGSIFVERHVRQARQAKARTYKSNSCANALQSYDDQDALQRQWQQEETPNNPKVHSIVSSSSSSSPLPSSSSRSQLLPSPVVPKWRKRVSDMSQDQLRKSLASQAADRAFDRLWRIENEPQQEIQLRDSCSCVYCSKTPSAYQTYEYQRMAQDPTYHVTTKAAAHNDKEWQPTKPHKDTISSISSAASPITSSSSNKKMTTKNHSHKSSTKKKKTSRSLTPPPPSSKKMVPSSSRKTRQRSTKQPTTTTSDGCRTNFVEAASDAATLTPSYISPLGNRTKIQYNKSSSTLNKTKTLPTIDLNQVTTTTPPPPSSKGRILTTSPAGVASLPFGTNSSHHTASSSVYSNMSTPNHTKPSLDDDVDEEQLLLFLSSDKFKAVMEQDEGRIE